LPAFSKKKSCSGTGSTFKFDKRQGSARLFVSDSTAQHLNHSMIFDDVPNFKERMFSVITRRRCPFTKQPQGPSHYRSISNSPYGRTHVWKRRPPVLPNPLVPKFPQKVIRSDGTSFTHWTTSPKSLVRLTRDTTNNPHWNTGNPSDRSVEDESGASGRLGRFSRKFEELGSHLDDTSWMEEMSTVMGKENLGRKAKPKYIPKQK
jgi:hypothetical protein